MINGKTAQIKSEGELNDALQAKNRLFALIYASWCPFCLRFLPVFERYAREAMGNFLMVQDDQELVADKYMIEVVPTVLFFKDGRVVKRLDGVLGVGLNEPQLKDFIKECSVIF
ncbi:MAG: thioredoxin family protein [Bacillota bacterium]